MLNNNNKVPKFYTKMATVQFQRERMLINGAKNCAETSWNWAQRSESYQLQTAESTAFCLFVYILVTFLYWNFEPIYIFDLFERNLWICMLIWDYS